MRKGIIISLIAHGVATLAVFVSVTFNQVTYFPRETYRVRLVTAAVAEPAAQATPPAAEAAPKPEPPKPEPPKEEPKEKELAQPVEKPKPKPKQEESKGKEVPRAQATKSADTTSTYGDAPAGPATGAESGAVSFDGGDFPYDAFIARMRQKIAAAWQVPAGSVTMERFAVVYFRVHRDGNITHVAVEQPSGVFLFDQSCQRAVLQAAPFPPLPREYINEYVGVHFSFKYVPKE